MESTLMENKKDWCTWFPEKWRGVYIGDCCKGHDSNCKTKPFFDCLKKKVGTFWAVIIAGGGAIGCLLRYQKL